MRTWKSILCGVCLAGFPAAWGQVDIGSISGTVTDSTNAVIPGVKITVRNETNKTTQAAVTNSSGYYTLTNLMVGEYSVTAEAKGFQKYVQSGIHLDAAQHLSVPVRMTVGEITQTVEVTGSAAQALSLEPSTGGTVTASQSSSWKSTGGIRCIWRCWNPGWWAPTSALLIPIASATAPSTSTAAGLTPTPSTWMAPWPPVPGNPAPCSAPRT